MLRLLPVLVSLLCLAPAFGAEPLTLERAIAIARDSSPQLQRAEAAANEASWKKLEALSGQIPTLSMTGLRLLSENYPVIPFAGTSVQIPSIPITSLNLIANWTLFDGFQTVRNVQAAALNSQAANLELERVQLEVDDQVRLRFYQALGAQQLAQVAEQNVRTLQDHLAQTQELLKQGSATRFDTLRVKVQLAEAYPDKAAADDNVVLTRQALAQAIGVEDDRTPLSGVLPEPRDEALPPEARFDPAARQDLQASLDRAEAAGRAHQGANAQFWPRIQLGYQFQLYNYLETGSPLTIPYLNAYYFTLSLTWNLWDGGATLARSRATLYQQRQAEASARALQLQGPNEFERWKRRYRYNVELYRARKESIDTAQESLRLAKIGYEAGTRTSTDVLDSELDLFRAKAGAVRAQVDSAEALINLELATGRKL